MSDNEIVTPSDFISISSSIVFFTDFFHVVSFSLNQVSTWGLFCSTITYSQYDGSN